MIRLLALLAVFLMAPGLAFAQQSPADLLNLPVDGSAAAWIIRTFGMLTVLSIAPGILVMVTSFPRFIIAFSILRTGMGLATAPSNMVLISMALFMTFYVMTPTFDRAWTEGVQPLLRNEINEAEAVQRIGEPFRAFMSAKYKRHGSMKMSSAIAWVKRSQHLIASVFMCRAVWHLIHHRY